MAEPSRAEIQVPVLSHLPLSRDAAQEVAHGLRALADPTRLQILSVIIGSEGERATVGQLAGALGLTQPTVTHHVRILDQAGVLEREADGKYSWLSVASAHRPAIEDLLR